MSLRFSALSLFFASLLFCAQSPAKAVHTFAVANGQFQFDGHSYQILSGEMHYPRVPRAYWRDRFRKARAMGLNTITTYVFWNIHEPRPGVYDFSRQNDVAEYIREAQQEGLNVILRPGPYVCAEWDLGGYPSWLLKDRSLILRSNDPKYIAAMNVWFKRLAREISPLLLQNGGPIIAIQVENEYGSFGNDHAYMQAVKSALLQSGLAAPGTLLYTADGADQISNGSLPELPAVINFGTGDAKSNFATLKKLRPNGPFMSGEYWAGWFDHWGEHHQTTDVASNAAEYEWMLRQGYSISMYMFHGGTSFGWMNGANSNGKNYEPDTTSYDYDAPLNESGQPTPKYMAFRDAIARVTGKTPPAIPAPTPASTYPIDPHSESASLWRTCPRLSSPTNCLRWKTSISPTATSSTALSSPRVQAVSLRWRALHDYAQIYMDRKLVGTLDRRLGESHLAVPSISATATLDILVENSGRVNFTKVIRTERKGITGSVTLGGHQPQHWQIYSLPMTNLDALHFTPKSCEGPCFYRFKMRVPAPQSSGSSSPRDTFLNIHSVSKGTAFLRRATSWPLLACRS